MIDERVKELVSKGVNRRTAYRIARRERNADEEEKFDYDRETPKGEWL